MSLRKITMASGGGGAMTQHGSNLAPSMLKTTHLGVQDHESKTFCSSAA
jgi:hypothetical protein